MTGLQQICRAVLVALLLSLLAGAIARAETNWSSTTPPVNLTHIFKGEINRHGKAVGLHVFPDATLAAHARVNKLLSGPNKAGVATAIVEIYDPATHVWKEKFSSLFPARLTRPEIIAAILHAAKADRLSASAKWRGPSGEGFLIEGYKRQDGAILTAYPLYVRDPEGD